MVSAWRNFKNIFPRPLFIIILRPEVLKFQPYSILTGDTRVEFIIYCELIDAEWSSQVRAIARSKNQGGHVVLGGDNVPPGLRQDQLICQKMGGGAQFMTCMNHLVLMRKFLNHKNIHIEVLKIVEKVSRITNKLIHFDVIDEYECIH